MKGRLVVVCDPACCKNHLAGINPYKTPVIGNFVLNTFALFERKRGGDALLSSSTKIKEK
jgi:hypothetical protein